MSNPLAWLSDELEALRSKGLRRRTAIRSTPQNASEIQLDGRSLINFGSNDYLGLAAQPELAKAAIQAVENYGWGSGASPLLGGRSTAHAELESLVAAFLGCEAALVFPTGFAANVGCLTALAGPGDTIFSDELNHASIIDGCRLSKAKVEVYPHRDLDHLATRLATVESGRRLIVTDSLFSMHGDEAPLAELAELAQHHRAMLMVDEAHATGVFGAAGGGLCQLHGVAPDIHVGTFSKALGSQGGFVAGTQPLIDWLLNRARPYFFSTASPPATAAASMQAIQMVREQPERRTRLLATSEMLRTALRDRGWSTGDSTGQIVPIHVGESARAMELSRRLFDAGLFVPGIRPPSVPAGDSLLRVSLSAVHDAAAIDRLLEALGENPRR